MRYAFGQSAADTVVAPEGGTDYLKLAPGTELSFHDAATGGTQVTDLVDTDGVTPVGPTLIVASTGLLQAFLGPDGVTTLWAEQVGGSGSRSAILARIPLTDFLAVNIQSGGAYPDRPAGHARVLWIGDTDPGAAALEGDYWNQI